MSRNNNFSQILVKPKSEEYLLHNVFEYGENFLYFKKHTPLVTYTEFDCNRDYEHDSQVDIQLIKGDKKLTLSVEVKLHLYETTRKSPDECIMTMLLQSEVNTIETTKKVYNHYDLVSHLANEWQNAIDEFFQ